MTYQTNPTRAEALWLDVVKRNPQRYEETFWEYMERLGDIMDAQNEPEAQRVEQVEPATAVEGGQS